MKIIKPLKLGLLYKTYGANDHYFLATTIACFFSFNSQPQLGTEINLWTFTAEELGNDAALDLGMPKPRGEVLVTGTFWSPRGQQVSAGQVRFRIGGIEKTLYVFGDRFWKRAGGATWGISDPKPVRFVDITYENAFGGSGYNKNPLGKGRGPVETDTGETVYPLPNVEDPRYLIASPKDKPDPACFGPLDLTWPQRFSKVGTYDEKWLNERFPGFAEDFDPTFFNTAPEDQQMQGFLKGDEGFICENMHPEKPVIRSQLPGIRPRSFINRYKGDDPVLQEVPMHLDTVWLFPHAEKGVLLFRGQTEVLDDVASDVAQILIAYERLGDTPREPKHYREALVKRIDKEKGHLHGLNEKDLIPAGERSAIQDLFDEGQEKQGDGLLEQHMKKRAEREVEKAREKLRNMGLNPDDLMDKSPEDQPEIGRDNLDELDVITEKMMQQAQDKRKEMEQSFRKMAESMGLDYDQLIQDAQKKSGGRIKFSADETIQQLRQFGLSDPAKEKKLHEAEKHLDDVYRQYGHYFPPAAKPSREENDRMRTFILEGYKKEASFTGMEFIGVDLSGLNLQGINLSGAFLEGADLSGSDLTGADLSGCMLARSNLSQAIFSKAQMGEINLGEADLTWADFSEAQLEKAVLCKAKLADTRFTDAKMVEADLSECKGRKANMRGADLTEARFMESELVEADFSESNVSEALFLNTQAKKINFTGAQLVSTIFVQFKGDGAVFTNADMTNLRAAMDITFRAADFSGAKLVNANLRSADLTGANFEKADISQADLSECNLENSRFYRAVAKQTMFMKADLTNANMISINLFEGSLQKAQLHNTDLRGANLFAADLLQTDFEHTKLEQANIQKTILSKWSPQ